MENPFIGEVGYYAFSFAPQGWAPCAGQLLPIFQNIPLFQLLGTRFGGDGHVTFGLPDYRGLSIPGTQYCIALNGVVPSSGGPSRQQSLGEIANLPYTFTPNSWVECNGQLLPITPNEALFTALGTKFGGDGEVNFGVPNLVQFSPVPPGPDTTSQYFIASEGSPDPADPFLAEVGLFPFDAAPNGWQTCSGQWLPVNRNQALFALLGFTFGGDGRDNFALPIMSGPPVPPGMAFCINVGGTFPPRALQSQFEEETLTESHSLSDEETVRGAGVESE